MIIRPGRTVLGAMDIVALCYSTSTERNKSGMILV